MNLEFAAALAEWHDFFGALAGIAGTLVGLLFVALGLNPAIMADDSPAGMRVWSAQTFQSLLDLLFLGLIGLVPDAEGDTLAIGLLIIGGQGLVRLALDVRRVRADPDPRWSGRQALTRFISPALAYLFCLWLARNVWQGNAEALGWLFWIVFLLTTSAAARSWELLKAIGATHREGTKG
jgi:hypothetical protein